MTRGMQVFRNPPEEPKSPHPIVMAAVAGLILLIVLGGLYVRGSRWQRATEPEQAGSPIVGPAAQAPIQPQQADSQQRTRFLAEADAAIQALEKVATAVEVGVGLVEYRTRITDAKVTVDRFLNAWSVDLVSPVRATVAQAMDEFFESVRLWQQGEDGVTNPSYEARIQFLRQGVALQKQGVATTKQARSALANR